MCSQLTKKRRIALIDSCLFVFTADKCSFFGKGGVTSQLIKIQGYNDGENMLVDLRRRINEKHSYFFDSIFWLMVLQRSH